MKLVFGILLMVFSQVVWSQSFLQFTENKGQWHPAILFESDIFSGKLYLEQQGFTYFFLRGDDYGEWQHAVHQHDKPSPNFTLNFHALKTRFMGSNKVIPRGDSAFSFYRNYFIGRDRSKWASFVRVHQSVRYPELYEGIDLLVYSESHGLKYDWILAPGADVSQIKVKYDGADDLFLDDGRLFIRTSINHLIEDAPKAYQIIDGKRFTVACKFVLKGKVLSFDLGVYNPEYELVIDPPILIFATYSGSSADNFGFTATYDSRGSLYAAGNVTSPYTAAPNGSYPATAGAFQVKPAGFNGASGPYGFFRCDIGVSKYDSSGTQLLWASYLGGTDNDYPHSLVVDHEDRLVLMGSSYSDDFPVDFLGFDTLQRGQADIIVVKFSFDGSVLLGSTYVGGNRNDGVLTGNLVYNFADNFRGDVQVSRSGNILVASCTNSNTGIPVTADALSKNLNGGYDGLLFELDSALQNMVWCTYWGGKKDDALYSLRIDKSRNLIAGGGTESDSIGVTSDAIFRFYQGGRADGMVLRIDQGTKGLIASSYIGTPAYDQVYFVDFDPSNHVYVFGQTEGFFPVIGNAYNFPGGGQFLIKMDEELDSVLMSTTLGNRTNNPNISPTAFLVDNCYNIYFAGWGSDEGVGHAGSTAGLPITPDAFQKLTDGEDFYLGVLDKNAQKLIYATYFGGTETADHVDGGTSRFDKRGVVYHSVCGSCPPYACCSGPKYFISDIPTTATAAFPTNLSPRCSNASFKLDFQLSYSVESDFIAAPLLGCSPLKVNFTNQSFKGTKFEWSFGDGAKDTGYDAVHIYAQPGKYIAYLKVTDSMSCNLTDSVSVEIEVINSVPSEFIYTVDPCGLVAHFFITSSIDAPLGYFWDFGDGTTSNLKNPKHEFPFYGSFTVTLKTNPSGTCVDSTTKQISLVDSGVSKIFIPNVFTPEGDAMNPCYGFVGLRSCDRVEVKIYNRYAQLVFESNSNQFCWDGLDLDSGKLLPAGVYYVISRVSSNSGPWEDYKGTVTMIY